MKALADRILCDGVNRFVFHRYAMQPWTDPTRYPGMTMGPWGVHYERTQTWWEFSKPWHEYLARCQYLLRQGLFVADICYLIPEAAPQGYQDPGEYPVYNFDNCSAEVVINRMSVKDGRIVLPDGMSYRVLALPDVSAMTPELLRKIKQLVDAGATVVGPAPERSPGLTGYPECDLEVKRLVGELWGPGKIAADRAPQQALAALGVPPDFSSDGNLRSIHRKTADADIYFVANPRASAVKSVATFRVSGMRPELWDPETGRIQTAPIFQEQNGVTRVALNLEATGSVFVVFRKGPVVADPVVTLEHDGRTVLSAASTMAKPVITKATYGVPDDPQRTIDVTAKVRQLLEPREIEPKKPEGWNPPQNQHFWLNRWNREQSYTDDRELPVSAMVGDDDPAPGVVKTLTINYTLGNKPLTVSGKDGETLYLVAPSSVKVTVDKAEYGVPGEPQRTIDVRANVQELADAGRCRFQVSPSISNGGDPAFGVVKKLVVDYTINNRRFTVTGSDAEMVSLVDQGATVPPVGIQADAAGQLTLEVWQPGNYESTTASGRKQHVDVPTLPAPQEITGPWQVAFDPKFGGPTSVTFDKLEDWSKRPEEGIKYFSGAATYRTTFETKIDKSQSGICLDLGKVGNMAEVSLNGKNLGILWKPPFRVDVTDAIRDGANTLEVKVVNLWINRQIGDEFLPEDSDRNPNGTLKSWPEWLQAGKPSPTGRFTFTTWRKWKKEDPLSESGLLGPVVLRTSKIVKSGIAP